MNWVTKKIKIKKENFRVGTQDPLYKRQRQQSRSLYWIQFMPQWFLRFSEIPEFTKFNDNSALFRENPILYFIRCLFHQHENVIRGIDSYLRKKWSKLTFFSTDASELCDRVFPCSPRISCTRSTGYTVQFVSLSTEWGSNCSNTVISKIIYVFIVCNSHIRWIYLYTIV